MYRRGKLVKNATVILYSKSIGEILHERMNTHVDICALIIIYPDLYYGWFMVF